MQELVFVTGIILKQSAVGEYDKRISILTKERGKITAFARGARKPSGKLAAATNPFSFGSFKLYPGRDAYTLNDAEIINYFEGFRDDFEAAYYGMYFMEVADYYTRENNDEFLMLGLLYQSLRALLNHSLPNHLVKCIYEIKTLVVNGEFPGMPKGIELQESTIYTIQYIQSSSLEKLYTFMVKDEVLLELKGVCDYYRKNYMQHEFKSLEILETLC